MRTLSQAALPAALSLAVLAGCAGDREPTAERAARADYARISGNANVILFGDAIGYRAGSAVSERVRSACREAKCSLGFGRTFSTASFGVGDVELEILPGRNGVRLVVERGSSETADVTAFGGWMEHGFFVSQANLFTDGTNPNHGSTVSYAYALGHSTGENPALPGGSAEWRGLVVGRDASVASSLESVVEGEAVIAVRMEASGMRADVAFSELANAHTGTAYDDMAWTGMAVTAGGFAREAAADDTIRGRFLGPDREEVGGVFERAGIAGAFGGRRRQ